ncbi:hypothetical protein O6H91_04G062100 [Diphasiastrum complanatum]|uniref:Uncharacterized protein n=1 Tax=Diphasiastrum complanatum TaxID=34168 RepID=A0ACC2DXL6_DIPCM|nr:hypothetical protein O6H91_04G062100 [Diphasiastrum complanatum]
MAQSRGSLWYRLHICLHLLFPLFTLYFGDVVADYNSHRLGRERSTWASFEGIFPEKLRGHFDDCMSIKDEGQRGVCQLLLATNTQASISQESDSGGGSDKSPTTVTDFCSYRKEGGPNFFLHASQRSTELQALLDSYTKMHRNCVSWEHAKLNEMYLKKLAPDCRYVVWSCTYIGLENKFLSLISSFLYALLSQRVLLVDQADWDSLFCEPFLGSSWIAPSGLSLKNAIFPSFSQFYDQGCGLDIQEDHPECNSSVVSVVFSENSKPSEHRFLVCPSAIASVRNVPILSFQNSNQYFAVGFFLNPVLRPVLEALFPEHNVFHLLSGFLLNPSQPVWEKVKNFYAMNLANSTRKIGVQLREFKGQYRKTYDTTSYLCIRSHSGLCPIEIDQAREKMKKEPNFLALNSQEYVSVYVSLPAGGHYKQLKTSVGKIERETGQPFRVFTQEADGKQLQDVGRVQKALIDIWLLSLSDVLITSHMSIIGYIAQGLAGITPHLLKPWRDNPCWLSVSSDPCFHFGPKKVVCQRDKFVMKNPLTELRMKRKL